MERFLQLLCKKGHSPRDCWTKQRDEEGAAGKNGIAALESHGNEHVHDGGDLGGFDIASVDIPICAVDGPSPYTEKGRITIDSGAAESVMPADMLKDIPLHESDGSRKGISYVAAKGGRMPNLGEKRVRFKTKDGSTSGIVFQVTHARKPLASVSKIVRHGNEVIFSPNGSYIRNVKTGRRIDIEEAHGTYHIEVDYLRSRGGPTEGFTRQA